MNIPLLHVFIHGPFSKPRGLKRALSEDMVALKVGKRHALKAGPKVVRLRRARVVALKVGRVIALKDRAGFRA